MSDIDQRGQNVTNQTNIINEATAPAYNYLHQVSPPVTDFVGREKEIDQLIAAVEGESRSAAILAAHGMGGIGKTELAKVIVQRLKDRFPEAQLYYDLRGANPDGEEGHATPVDILSHIVRSFVPEEKLPDDEASLRGMYQSLLNGKSVLLLMDNAANATQLRPLAPPPEGCALLVTSRQRFTLSGMEAVDLDTLSPEQAEDLLLEICPRVGDHAQTLAKHCGYLPLALRLAASALKLNATFTVGKYTEQLADSQARLATLDEFAHLTEVERGVEATLEISYNLLSEADRVSWCRLSVFPGTFDAPAAVAVAFPDDDPKARTMLSALHNASMLQWDDSTNRYRFHDLAQAFACNRMSDAEIEEAGLRHAEHYLGVLRNADELYLAGADDVVKGLALLDNERSNIEAGQAWASSRLDKRNDAARLCMDFPDAGIYCLTLRMHSRKLIDWLNQAFEGAREIKNRWGEGNALGNLGLAHTNLEDYPKAIEYYEQHLEIAREVGDRSGEGTTLGNLGIAHRNLGDAQKAIAFYEQHLDIARDIGDRRGEGTTLGNLGTAHANLGDPRKAIEFYEQHLEIARDIGDRRGEANASFNLAVLLLEDQKLDAAECHAMRAVELYEQIESPNLDDAENLLARIRTKRQG